MLYVIILRDLLVSPSSLCFFHTEFVQFVQQEFVALSEETKKGPGIIHPKIIHYC